MQDIEPHRRADVAMDNITAQRRQWLRDNRRPRALSAREALEVLRFEALLLWVSQGNLRNGLALTDEDWERCTLAMNRIEAICDEAIG
jgi:hypothetical protein